MRVQDKRFFSPFCPLNRGMGVYARATALFKWHLICLRMLAQPARNPKHNPKPKSNRQHSLLVVVVYSNFSATTTIGKQKTTD